MLQMHFFNNDHIDDTMYPLFEFLHHSRYYYYKLSLNHQVELIR